MSITREQVADLQPGDVIEARHRDWPEGQVIRGPVGEFYSQLRVAGFAVSNLTGPAWTLTVVSRAPRALYVNHARTKPVLGDVVSRGDTDGAAWSYCPRPMRGMGNRWRNTANDEWFADEDFIDWGNGLRLLVDGETGQVVPS